MNMKERIVKRICQGFYSRKSGQGSVELAISGVMFVLMFAALAALSIFLFVSHTFTMAANVGVREAATEQDLADPDTYAQGVSNVQQRVQNFIQGSSGIQVDTADITVQGPDGPVGDRQVTVSISYEFENPVPILTTISTVFGGDYGDDTLQLNSSATMRYEE